MAYAAPETGSGAVTGPSPKPYAERVRPILSDGGSLWIDSFFGTWAEVIWWQDWLDLSDADLHAMRNWYKTYATYVHNYNFSVLIEDELNRQKEAGASPAQLAQLASSLNAAVDAVNRGQFGEARALVANALRTNALYFHDLGFFGAPSRELPPLPGFGANASSANLLAPGGIALLAATNPVGIADDSGPVVVNDAPQFARKSVGDVIESLEQEGAAIRYYDEVEEGMWLIVYDAPNGKTYGVFALFSSIGMTTVTAFVEDGASTGTQPIAQASAPQNGLLSAGAFVADKTIGPFWRLEQGAAAGIPGTPHKIEPLTLKNYAKNTLGPVLFPMQMMSPVARRITEAIERPLVDFFEEHVVTGQGPLEDNLRQFLRVNTMTQESAIDIALQTQSTDVPGLGGALAGLVNPFDQLQVIQEGAKFSKALSLWSASPFPRNAATTPVAGDLPVGNLTFSEGHGVAVNLGGEGEIPGVINQQGPWARDQGWGAARESHAGMTLQELAEEGHVFVVSRNDRLPFGDHSVDTVFTNNITFDQDTWLGPGVQSSEIWRILTADGRWIHNGVEMTRP